MLLMTSELKLSTVNNKSQHKQQLHVQSACGSDRFCTQQLKPCVRQVLNTPGLSMNSHIRPTQTEQEEDHSSACLAVGIQARKTGWSTTPISDTGIVLPNATSTSSGAMPFTDSGKMPATRHFSATERKRPRAPKMSRHSGDGRIHR